MSVIAKLEAEQTAVRARIFDNIAAQLGYQQREDIPDHRRDHVALIAAMALAGYPDDIDDSEWDDWGIELTPDLEGLLIADEVCLVRALVAIAEETCAPPATSE